MSGFAYFLLFVFQLLLRRIADLDSLRAEFRAARRPLVARFAAYGKRTYVARTCVVLDRFDDARVVSRGLRKSALVFYRRVAVADGDVADALAGEFRLLIGLVADALCEFRLRTSRKSRGFEK